MIIRMSCQDLSAALGLLGLTAELGAVVWILSGVGLGDWIRRRPDAARAGLARGRAALRRLWPWAKPPESKRVELNLAASAEASASMELTVGRATDRPAPASFEEVGERLNRIAEDLNRHEQEIKERAERLARDLRSELDQVESESTQRHEERDHRIEADTRNRFAERKREGIVFAGGVVLQLAGVVVLLFFC